MADKKISALPAATTPLAGTEVLPIVQSGVTDQVSVANLTTGRDVTVKKLNPTDNVVMAAGKGIDFSANGGDVLTQYDEGTWTPTDASGAGLTLTVVTAKYTRIGRLVTVNCYVQYPVTADASAVRITLPFTATSFDIATAAAGTGAVFSGLTMSGTAHMSLRAPSLSSILNDQVSGADVIFTCSYMV